MGRCKYGDHNSGSKPYETDRDMRRGVQAFRDANAEAERQKERVAVLRPPCSDGSPVEFQSSMRLRLPEA